jgi:DNA (cytosine-5)-methyltransferase 1
MLLKSCDTIRYIDLFCGVGGFRIAAERAAKKCQRKVECVFSSDIDNNCQKQYRANFNETPFGDITEFDANDIPDHEVLLAGFPCQPFSIIGSRKGFEDIRGTLFFYIAKIIEAKKPKVFILENVKLLARHNNSKTLNKILETLMQLGYNVDYRIFNALDFGLPQKRERIFIVGFRDPCEFNWPNKKIKMKPLSSVLESNIPPKFYASEKIQASRLNQHKQTDEPTIWHENKSGNIAVHPYSCALRAGASYNYLLVNGIRRLTPREMFRLQGFPDSYKLVCNDSQLRKQAGNSLPVPIAEAVIQNVINASFINNNYEINTECLNFAINGQFRLFEKGSFSYAKSKIKNRRKISAAISA